MSCLYTLHIDLTVYLLNRITLICIADSYVLYERSSYLHCKWATLKELEKDPRIHQKIKRFRTKQAQMKHLFTEVTSPVAEVKALHSAEFHKILLM